MTEHGILELNLYPFSGAQSTAFFRKK